MKKIAFPLIAFCATSGCFSLEDLNTDSEFLAPGSTGAYSVPLFNERSGSETNGQGDGFSYRVGSAVGGGFIGQAGLIPGSDVLPAPATGSASYTGRWELAKVTSIFIEGGNINGFSSTDSGTITLLADFDDGSISGASGGLSIDGNVSGGQLSGDVTYNGTEGDLTGIIGSDQAIGAFHGNDGNQIFAGGFVTEAD